MGAQPTHLETENAMPLVKKRHRREQAVDLDREIEGLLRDFIPLGQKLMEMRDSRLYRELPNPETGEAFGTFDEYVRVRVGMAKTEAYRTIRASLVGGVITMSPKGDAVSIRKEHARLFSESQKAGEEGIARFEYREEKLPQGGVAKVPVAVANPDELREVWAEVARKYKAAFERAKEKKPKLTVSFISRALPDKYQKKLPHPRRTPPKAGKAGAIIKLAGRLSDGIRDLHFDDLERVKEVAEKEGWTKSGLDEVRAAMKEVEDAVARARDVLGRIRR